MQPSNPNLITSVPGAEKPVTPVEQNLGVAAVITEVPSPAAVADTTAAQRGAELIIGVPNFAPAANHNPEPTRGTVEVPMPADPYKVPGYAAGVPGQIVDHTDIDQADPRLDVDSQGQDNHAA